MNSPWPAPTGDPAVVVDGMPLTERQAALVIEAEAAAIAAPLELLARMFNQHDRVARAVIAQDAGQ